MCAGGRIDGLARLFALRCCIWHEFSLGSVRYRGRPLVG